MSSRSPLCLALLALFAGTALVLQAVDPDPSLIMNHSTNTYHVRISDDCAPAGVVKFYADTDEELSKPLEKPIQSKDQFYLLEPGKTVKMVICPSPVLKNVVVALFMSLDLMDGSSVKTKSASRIHFVHGQYNKTQYNINQVKSFNNIGNILDKIKPLYNTDPVSYKNKGSGITVSIEGYQHPKASPALWTID